jgi:predicted GNAT family N-acyltransferase
MDFSKYTFRQIDANTKIKPFDCGDTDLNDFLFSDAKDYLSSMMALTYLLEDNGANKTIAYYSLLNDKIVFDPEEKHFWNRLNRNVANSKRRKDYPAVKIGRLAVSKEYSGIHIGETIILQVKHIFSTMSRSACRFITVDAYAAAVPFYEKCGFTFLSDKDKYSKARAMYFDLINFGQQ